MNLKKIVIFASGSGSNAENIINYFRQHKLPVEFSAIFTNNDKAYILERARNLDIPAIIFDKDQFTSGEVLKQLDKIDPDLIVLAGFLKLIPEEFIDHFRNKIINIHPALLPKYGGKGMYGMHVHKSVYENREKETGITIHYVNSQYDEGKIITQQKCDITSEDTPEAIAKKVHELEYKYFPPTIKKLLFPS